MKNKKSLIDKMRNQLKKEKKKKKLENEKKKKKKNRKKEKSAFTRTNPTHFATTHEAETRRETK